jgi:hypothetical protein
VAARNFRGTIRQESIAPSATGGRTSASRMSSRDRREEFNGRSSIADTVDYNFKAIQRPSRGAHLADGRTPHCANTLRPTTIRLHLRKSTRSRGGPCPGCLPSLKLRWSNAAFPPVETEDSPKPAMRRERELGGSEPRVLENRRLTAKWTSWAFLRRPVSGRLMRFV